MSILTSAAARIGGPRPNPARLDEDRAARSPAIARIAVFATVGAAKAAWLALQSEAAASPYQSFAWMEAWLASTASRGVTPAIAVAFDADDRPIALFPFGRRRWAGLMIGSFLGGSDSNCSLAMVSPRVPWGDDTIRWLVRAAARTAGLDLLTLRHQPLSWAGRANPLLALGSQPSPSGSRATALLADPEQFFKTKLSKHARKLLRQKETKLRALGAIGHRIARNRKDVAAFVEAYLRQKAARFEAAGITALDDPEALRSFLTRAADPDHVPAPPVELHALTCGDEIVAVFGGAGHDRHFAGMVIAFEGRPEIARCSPGDLLLAAVIADLCRRGFERFDLGIGEARYKETFCDEVDPRVDSFVGLSLVGQAVAPMLAFAMRGKGVIKTSDRAWSLVRGGRRLAGRLRRLIGR